MKVEITDQHIECGVSSETSCPVAHALKEATGEIWFVYRTYIRRFGTLYKFELPKPIAQKIESYDHGQGMEPFDFEIDLIEPEKSYRARVKNNQEVE